MDYLRVLPRDLFNEANLQKCYGKLWVELEPHFSGEKIEEIIQHDDEAFIIGWANDDGETTIFNISLYSDSGIKIPLRRPCNSRRDWPLLATDTINDDIYIEVFNGDGSLTDEFLELVKS